MYKRAWRAAVHGVTKSWTLLNDFHFHFHFSFVVGLMATSSKRTYANTLCLPGRLLPVALSPQQAAVDPRLHRRLLDTHRQVRLSRLWGHGSFPPGPGVQKVFFVSSKSLEQVWSLILTWLCLLLLSRCSFSFVLGQGMSFFGGFQHPPVDGCSAASCDFGVLAEDERRGERPVPLLLAVFVPVTACGGGRASWASFIRTLLPFIAPKASQRSCLQCTTLGVKLQHKNLG